MFNIIGNETTDKESEKWIQSINQGGLVAIDDITYQVLVSIELELRNHFTVANATRNDINLNDLGLQNILVNEDVLFYWAITSVNWDCTEAKELLKMFAEH